MPLDEYKCTQCGRQEERLESLSAPSGHDCPECGAALGMARSLSAPSLALSSSPAPSPAAHPCASGGGCPYGH